MEFRIIRRKRRMQTFKGWLSWYKSGFFNREGEGDIWYGVEIPGLDFRLFVPRRSRR